MPRRPMPGRPVAIRRVNQWSGTRGSACPDRRAFLRVNSTGRSITAFWCKCTTAPGRASRSARAARGPCRAGSPRAPRRSWRPGLLRESETMCSSESLRGSPACTIALGHGLGHGPIWTVVLSGRGASHNAAHDHHGLFSHSLAGPCVNAEETADWLAAIVESSDDAIIGKTLAGVITTWNHAAERMYGYPADEMIGKHVSLLLPPVHRMRSRHPRPCRTR